MGKETFRNLYFVTDDPTNPRAGATVYCNRIGQACEDVYNNLCRTDPHLTALAGGLLTAAWGATFGAAALSTDAHLTVLGGLITAAYGWTFAAANPKPMAAAILRMPVFEAGLYVPAVEAVLQSPVVGHVGELCAGVGDYVGEVFPHSPLAASAGNAIMIWGGIQVARFVVAVGLGLYEDINASQRDR